jgi:hypothetical protein
LRSGVWAGLLDLSASILVQMAEKTEFVLGANFATPYGSGSQLIFSIVMLLLCDCEKKLFYCVQFATAILSCPL